jgi:hypothetical protein
MIRYSMDAHTEVSNLPRILVMASEHTLLLGFKWSSTVSSLLVSLQRKTCTFVTNWRKKVWNLEEVGSMYY